jgi:hypothetical protein
LAQSFIGKCASFNRQQEARAHDIRVGQEPMFEQAFKNTNGILWKASFSGEF